MTPVAGAGIDGVVQTQVGCTSLRAAAGTVPRYSCAPAGDWAARAEPGWLVR